jgi:hypothetical protein
MTMHKDELISTTRSSKSTTARNDANLINDRLKKTIARHNQTAIMQQAFLEETARKNPNAKAAVVLPWSHQWKSQRRRGSAVYNVAEPVEHLTPIITTSSSPVKTEGTWSKHKIDETPMQVPVLPELNFSALQIEKT